MLIVKEKERRKNKVVWVKWDGERGQVGYSQLVGQAEFLVVSA